MKMHLQSLALFSSWSHALYTGQQPLAGSASIAQPSIGFGTWNLKESGANTSSAVAFAIETGYRQIDCAAAYGNEKDVGRGIAEGLRRTGLKRSDIWVTSKLWNDHHDPERVEEALNQTLSDLGLEYLDLYLMHWPVGKSPTDKTHHPDYLTTWQAMTHLPHPRVHHIGISNFSPAQLSSLLLHSPTAPSVHQMELHPYLPQAAWLAHHQKLGIAVTAYSPLGNMNPTYGDAPSHTTISKAPLLLENPVITRIARKRGCTPAQVVLAWGMGRGVSVIPKSKHEGFIEENFGARGCGLGRADVRRIEGLGRRPRRFNNPSRGWGVRLFEGLDDV